MKKLIFSSHYFGLLCHMILQKSIFQIFWLDFNYFWTVRYRHVIRQTSDLSGICPTFTSASMGRRVFPFCGEKQSRTGLKRVNWQLWTETTTAVCCSVVLIAGSFWLRVILIFITVYVLAGSFHSTSLLLVYYIYIFVITFIMHLADNLIQSDMQWIQAILFHQYVCSLGIEPTTFWAANAMLEVY